MDINLIRIVVTLTSFLLFAGILVWAFHPKK